MRLWPILVLTACSGAPTPEPVPEPAPIAVPEPPEPEPPPVPAEPKYAATHVLIAWAGAVRAPESVTRSREEAHALAESIHARAVAGEPLDDLARAHSDGPSAPRGGTLGVYLTGTMVPAFEAAVASVEVGEVAPLVETPFGWHVVRRDAVIEAEVAHILVGHAEAWRSTSERSKVEARARAEEALARLSEGAPFEEVAAAYSDDATASRGGDLGVVAPGQMIPAFEDAVFALAPGETSGVVETPYGFHVITRKR